jgi:hypothetical protein
MTDLSVFSSQLHHPEQNLQNSRKGESKQFITLHLKSYVKFMVVVESLLGKRIRKEQLISQEYAYSSCDDLSSLESNVPQLSFFSLQHKKMRSSLYPDIIPSSSGDSASKMTVHKHCSSQRFLKDFWGWFVDAE